MLASHGKVPEDCLPTDSTALRHAPCHVHYDPLHKLLPLLLLPRLGLMLRGAELAFCTGLQR